MSEEHLQFLKEKFILDYEEAVEEFHDELPLRLHLQEILEILNQNTITSSTPIRMKRPLYGLKYALAECVTLAEEEREKWEKAMERKAQNKRSLPSVTDAHNFVKNHWFLFKTRRKLLSIKEQLLQDMRADDDAAAADAAADQNSVGVHQPGDYQFFLEKEIYGFNDHLQEIEAFLLDDGPANSNGIKALGIVGIGGSGKTALAKKVFSSSRVQESFYPMIWVELPLSPIPLQSIVTAVCERFSSCGVNDHDNDLGILLRKMHDCLLNTKYLIVLDGVWHASDWFLDLNSNSNLQMEGNHFQHGLPKNSGGAIIITSRFQDVATKIVGEQNLYHLEPTLDSQSCWSLMLDSMPKNICQDPCLSIIRNSMPRIVSENSRGSSILDVVPKFMPHPILMRMRAEMVDRCDGLPLAAKALVEIVCERLKEEGFLLTESITRDEIKLICLKIYKPHGIPISEVLEYIRTYPGVHDACFSFEQNNSIEVVVKTEIFFHTEELTASLSSLAGKTEIVLSIEIYYHDSSRSHRVAAILPCVFNQNALSGSWLAYHFVHLLFLDPSATKEFYLSVDGNDHFGEILQRIRSHPVVCRAQSTYTEIERREIMVETYNNPLELMKDLRKYYAVEIINSRIEVYYKDKWDYNTTGDYQDINSNNESLIPLGEVDYMNHTTSLYSIINHMHSIINDYI